MCRWITRGLVNVKILIHGPQWGWGPAFLPAPQEATADIGNLPLHISRCGLFLSLFTQKILLLYPGTSACPSLPSMLLLVPCFSWALPFAWSACCSSSFLLQEAFPACQLSALPGEADFKEQAPGQQFSTLTANYNHLGVFPDHIPDQSNQNFYGWDLVS